VTFRLPFLPLTTTSPAGSTVTEMPVTAGFCNGDRMSFAGLPSQDGGGVGGGTRRPPPLPLPAEPGPDGLHGLPGGQD
jgi:hypothetical protein